MYELRFHGRGGQGTVVASKLLAVALHLEGREVQSFPMFGVERRGAPVTAFLRVSDSRILLRCEVQEPDALVVLDPTLVGAIDVTAGLKPGGSILLNSDRPPEEHPQLLEHFRLSTVDASGIAIRFGLGSKTQPIVNTAILGALAADSGLVRLESVREAIRETVPMHVEENIGAAMEAARSVRRIGETEVARV